MDETCRKGLLYNGVCYQEALSRPGGPLADFARLPVDALAAVPLEEYDVLLAPRSADGEALRARRHQIARFLDAGGVLIAFGELWTDWFPGCAWRAECPADIRRPVVLADHPLLAGYDAAALHWHPANERWCCHGHLAPPPGAEVLVANDAGDAWTYLDRATTRGTILASTNLDPDTHAFHGSPVAREVLARVVAWAEREAARNRATGRRTDRSDRIAGLFSGVHFQRGFYEDPEYRDRFAVVPAAELGALPLDRYRALWVPRESNQEALLAARERLAAYLEAGGTLVSFEEPTLPWLPRGDWAWRTVDVATLTAGAHPLVRDLAPEEYRWHAHGAYAPYPGLEPLLTDGAGEVVLGLDERSFAGRLLLGTLDPDCHAGFGSGRTRPLLRRVLDWVLAPAPRAALA
ncbi:MAG TPA: hypothetical protein VFW96_04600 [Thermomicrobiales bacterium]|nr:hypothetical protein [Thermomicrobiales bacterium]